MAPVRFIANLLRRLPSFNWPSKPGAGATPHIHQLGAWGERYACKALRKAGYRILKRNFEPATYGKRGGQVDIVARHGRALVFIEVKTRRSGSLAGGAEGITPAQSGHILQAALSWLEMLGNPDVAFRFDVVEVYWNPATGQATAEIIPNAIDLPENFIYAPESPDPTERRARRWFG
jgi:putative endonuclease